MTDRPTALSDRPLADLIGILRRLASTVRGINDDERFLGSLERVFQRVGELSGREVRFGPAAADGESKPFSEPELTAPVAVGEAVAGLVRVAPPAPDRPFGAEDLHLVGTLAELTAALLEVSRRLKNDESVGRMLRLVYDQLPVGVVCFSADGGPTLANARAQLMLEGMMWRSRDEALAFLESRSAVGDSASGSAQSCFAAAAGTVLAEAHEVATDDAPPTTVIVLVALDTHERNLRLTLEREIYRSRWLGQPLAFVVLESAGDPGRLFARLPDIRLSLRSGDCCEVLGDRQIGLVLPGRERVQALQTARLVGRTVGAAALRSACLLLGEGNERADVMIQETVAALEPADSLLHPRLLVVDRYRAVPDTVELVMRKTFAVEKAANSAEGIERLRATPVDAVVVEHEPDEGFSGFDFLQAARGVQPDVAAILTTTRIDLPRDEVAIPDNARFLRKPFSVDGLRQTLAAVAPGLNPPS